jgi:myb proto-oncogene protein
MRRKNGTRTMPVPAVAAGNPELPPPPPPEDEDLPAAKKPRLQAPTSNRWNSALDPANGGNKGKTLCYWEPEEDAKLAEAVSKHGKHWPVVAKVVTNRTGDQCRQRWIDTLDPAKGNKCKIQNHWKPEQVANLTKAVKKYDVDWVAVAKLVPGRRSEQCRQKWRKERVKQVDPNHASNTLEEESYNASNDEALDLVSV